MTPSIGIVAGSGIDLHTLFDSIEQETPFADIPGLAVGHVAGHASVFLRGHCAGQPVVVQSGRLHPYEGLDFDTVTRTVDAFHAFGVRTVIFTNAVGGLLPTLRPGDLVAADDVRTWRYNAFDLPPQITPDFVPPHCDAQGRYYWMHGPCYETQAEIAALQHLGAATVGMSTAPELHRCAILGLRAGVISCVTNSCVTQEHLTHASVLAIAHQTSAKLSQLLRATLPGLVAG